MEQEIERYFNGVLRERLGYPETFTVSIDETLGELCYTLHCLAV